MGEMEIANERQQKDTFFKSDPHSPLPLKMKDGFSGLDYFPYRGELDLQIELTLFDEGDVVQIMTTTNEIRNYRRHGEFTFTVDGQQGRLTIYQTPHGFFLPFVDRSDETYPAGRYIDPEPVSRDVFHVDFNRAYNPFCAYNENYSCPLTPPENRVAFPIPAGEKLFKKS